MAKYWNGEPVCFVCRSRKTEEPFFVVTFELQAEDGGSLGPVKAGTEKVEKEQEEVAQSDDVD